MRAQKLKTFDDFLKRAEIIPQTLLIITGANTLDYEKTITVLRRIKSEIPLYELCLLDESEDQQMLIKYLEIEHTPTVFYFRGMKLIRKIVSIEEAIELFHFIQPSFPLGHSR